MAARRKRARRDESIRPIAPERWAMADSGRLIPASIQNQQSKI